MVQGGCGLERLGLDFDNRSLVEHLLELRGLLERSRSEQEAAAALARLAQLVPPDLSEA